MAMQKLEWQVAAVDPESQYVLVFNPHTWDVTGNFEYDFIWSSKHKSSRVEDEQGNSLPHQWTLGSSQAGSRKKLIVKTTIPAFGYRQIRLLDGDAFKINKDVTAKNNQLENEYLRVSFSDDGNIGIFDKTTGQELFDGGKTGCRAIIIDDPSDTWSHDVVSFSDEIGSFKSAEIKVLENGPLRAIVRVKTAYGNSFLTIDWILYSGSKNLKAKVSLDWHEQLKMLKFSFPVNVESPTSTYETAYGNIERAVNGDENPGQRWIDVTGKQNGKTYGLTVMNDAKYGYNVIDNDMRISIARAAVFAHHRPKKLDPSKEYLWMDQGIQTFEMLIVPHENSWRESNIVKTADEFSASFIPIYQGIHGGAMPKSGSFLSCDSENVLVSALKKAEDGDDLIIRCVETLGLTTDATVDLRFAGSKWTGSFSPYEIKTLRMDKSTGSIKEVSLLEE